MSYTISRWALTGNGFPFTLNNDTVNTTSTPLTLLGQGVSNYGQSVAEDFLYLLENFAGPNPPAPALAGSIWFDSSVNPGVLRVYDLNGNWDALGTSSPVHQQVVTIQSTPPSLPAIGDLWLNTSTSPSNLEVWNGSAWLVISDVQNSASFVTLSDGPGVIINNGLVYGKNGTIQFITPPSVSGTYLRFDGTNFGYTAPLFKDLGDVFPTMPNNAVLISSNSTNTAGQGTINYTPAAPLTGINFLQFNGTAFVWSDPLANRSINDLSDVQTTTPLANQALVFNGSNWTNQGLKFQQLANVPQSVPAKGILVGDAGGVNVTSIAAPTIDGLLHYNLTSGTFEWIANTLNTQAFVNLVDGPHTIVTNGVVVGNNNGTALEMIPPTSSNQSLTWNGSVIEWASTISHFIQLSDVPNTIITNGLLFGDDGSLSYVSAPTTSGTYLNWNGSGFVWANALPATGSITASMLAAGVAATEFTQLTDVPETITANGLVVGNTNGTALMFAPAPSTGMYLQWNGSSYQWANAIPAANSITSGMLAAGATKFVALGDGPGNISANAVVVGNSSANGIAFSSSAATPNTFLRFNGTGFDFATITVATGSITQTSLAQGLAFGISSNLVTFNSNGTFSWTAPANTFVVEVEVIGGSGGGSGVSLNSTGGHSGGAGGFAKKKMTVVPGQNYAVVVGSDGAAGISGSSGFVGSDGSLSSFNNTVIAQGGQGGQEFSGGTGGAAMGGDINLVGNAGQVGPAASGVSAPNGSGGGLGNLAGIGGDGNAPGGSGAGGSTNFNAGAGAVGCVRIYF